MNRPTLNVLYILHFQTRNVSNQCLDLNMQAIIWLDAFYLFPQCLLALFVHGYYVRNVILGSALEYRIPSNNHAVLWIVNITIVPILNSPSL